VDRNIGIAYERRRIVIVRLLAAVLLFATTLLVSQGAQAGGWVSVRVADDLAPPIVGETWSVELIVRQHDRTEVDVDQLSVHFSHQESGAGIGAIAESTGQLGHYALPVVLDRPGIWDWTATPAPFGPMKLESLEVLEPGATSELGAPRLVIVQGTCSAPGAELGEIELTETDDLSESGMATGILTEFGDVVSKATTDAIAVIVERAGVPGSTLACGEISASMTTSPAVVTLGAVSDSTTVGSLSLVPVEGGVTATATVLTTAPGQGVLIRITDTGDGMFTPGAITIPAGTTVTWQNDSSIAHTVAGTTEGFLSSGMLDHGERFSQTFDEAGVFPYACGPHSWMTGTITVVA
jgi:plastocyanin